ncbi:MAG: NAD-dependent epimerase/dehydratase family protein [Catalinimonas sp.]
MRIVITGGAGFVGSSLALSLKENYPSYEVTVLDNLKRKGSELNLPRLADGGVKFVHGDIRNAEDFMTLPPADAVIEASAEPSVLAGLDAAPDYLINTNLLGTVRCLEYARRHGAKFVFLSTSRVYPIETIEGLHYRESDTRFELLDDQDVPGASSAGIAEDFPLAGVRSLYGATKLASELLIQEYNHFYELPTVINRCGVLSGPWQMGKVDQGVMVLWVARHFWQGKLSYLGYGGTGHQVRDVLHVKDLFRLVDHQLHHFEQANGQTYNVGGGPETSVSLAELTERCQKATGHQLDIGRVTENRTADLRYYITDNRRITEATGWRPEITIEQTVDEIYDWLKANEAQLKYVLG